MATRKRATGRNRRPSLKVLKVPRPPAVPPAPRPPAAPPAPHCHMKHGVPGLALVVFLFAALALIFIPVFDWLSQQFINSQLPELLGMRTWVSAYFITVGYYFFAAGLVLALVLSAIFGRLLQGRHRD